MPEETKFLWRKRTSTGKVDVKCFALCSSVSCKRRTRMARLCRQFRFTHIHSELIGVSLFLDDVVLREVALNSFLCDQDTIEHQVWLFPQKTWRDLLNVLDQFKCQQCAFLCHARTPHRTMIYYSIPSPFFIVDCAPMLHYSLHFGQSWLWFVWSKILI